MTAVTRHLKGKVVVMTWNGKGHNYATTTETQTMLLALKFVQQWCFQKIIIDSDYNGVYGV